MARRRCSFDLDPLGRPGQAPARAAVSSSRTTRYCVSCLTTFFDDPESCTNLTCGQARPSQGWGVLLRPGDLLDRHYVVERVLAVGGAGLTYLARESDGDGEPTGPKLAIKVLYTARDTGPFLRRLANEAQILQELAHDHIVQCYGFVQRVGQEPYLVTLFEEGGSLRQHVERVGPLPPAVAVGILRQVLLALDVAHQRAVVHRDLKPDNVLLRQAVDVDELPHVRVADFGIAKVHGGLTDRLTKLGSFVGTPEYAAPEQFEGLQPTPAADLFAAGGLLWFLLTASPPVTFSQRNDLATSYEELLDQVPPQLAGTPHHIKDPDAVKLLQEVIDHLMHHDAERRWTVHQVLRQLTPLSGEALAMARDASTLEITNGGAPQRDATPTFSLDDSDEQPATSAPEPPTIPPPPGRTHRDPADAPDPPSDAGDPPDESLPWSDTEEGPTTAPVEVASAHETAVPSEESSASNTLEPSLEPPSSPRPPRPSLPDAEPASASSKTSAASTQWLPASQAPTQPTPTPALRRGGTAPAAAADLPPLEEPSRSGGVGRAAGCLGLSFMGVVMTSGGGLLSVAAVLLGAAWGFGWFGGPSQLEVVHVPPGPPSAWERAPHMLGRNGRATQKRLEIQEALSAKAKVVGRSCKVEQSSLAEVLIDPDGDIVYAAVDPEGLSADQRACVDKELRRLDLDLRTPRQARVRVALPLGR